MTFICEQLGVARSGYYRWLTTGPYQRERDDTELIQSIRQIHGNPGVR